MTYISILDHSTGRNCIVEDEENLTQDLQVEDIQALLHCVGFRNDQISFMVTDEDPQHDRVTLRELCDTEYKSIENECVRRLKGTESNG